MSKYSILLTRVILPFVILSIVLSSCSSLKNGTTPISISDSNLNEEQYFEFQYNFFEANRFYLSGNMDMALTVFQQCLKIDPTSNVCHYKVASIYLAKKDLEKASIHADQAIVSTDNIWYLYLSGTIYSKTNQKEKAIYCFDKLINIEPNQMDFYLSLADVYLQNNELKEAIEIYDNVDIKFGKSELISLQKNKIYMSLNKKDEAIQELVDLYNYYDQNPVYKRLLADFYIQINDFDNAIITYNEVLEANVNDGYAYIGLAECYRLKGDINTSFSYIKRAFSATDLPSDVKVSLLFNMLQSAQNNLELQREIYELVDILYLQYPENLDIKALYVNLLIDKQEFVQARDLLREVTYDRKDKYAIWEQLVLLENQLFEWDSLYIESTEALTYFPTQSFLHFFQGFSAFQLEKFPEALNAFEFGFRLTTPKDPLRMDFISFLGEINHKLGHKQKAYEYFDQYLAIDPDNIGVLNNYAYYLSLDKEQLIKAASMSKITVDKEPNNSTYLDTYAWVLFEQKDYINALVYIKKAVSNDSDSSSVIIEHYGDILYFNDKTIQAVEQWNNAFKLDDTNELLKRKIDAKSYFEK